MSILDLNKITEDPLGPKQLISDENNKIIIPKDYFWCQSCAALTPQEKNKIGFYNCLVCGSQNEPYGCPNCGYPEPDEDLPLYLDVQVHLPGCHFRKENDEDEEVISIYHSNCHADKILNQFGYSWTRMLRKIRRQNNSLYIKLLKRLDEERNRKCGCPTYRVYPTLNVRNFSSQGVFSMDCMNAIEWSYDVLCPACGYIYHVQDGNC